MEQAVAILRNDHPGLLASKQKLRKLEGVECVRLKRGSASQHIVSAGLRQQQFRRF